MSERSRNVRVGLFVLGAVGLLLAGLFAFGLREALEPRLDVETAIAGDVQGLAVGSAVEIRGIRVGKVSSIGFTWNDYPGTRTDLAVVRFEIKRSILPVRSGAEVEAKLKEQVDQGFRVRVRSQALTGTAVLALERVDPAKNPPPVIDYQPRDLYIPSASSQLTRMLDAIERTLDTLKEIRVQPILDRAAKLVASLETLAGKVNAVRIDRIEAKANVAADEVVLAAKDLHAGVASARAQVEALKLGEAGDRLNAVLAELQEAAKQLRGTLEKVDGIDVDGLNDAVTSLRRASDQLDQTLQEIRDYPAGSILGKPPARPAGVEGGGATEGQKEKKR